VQVLTGAGIGVGVLGGAVTGFGLSFAASPEPYGLVLLYPPGAVLLGVGSGMALGGSLAQAHRVGASPTPGWGGGGLVGGAIGVFAAGAATGTEAGAAVALFGAPTLGVAALALGACRAG
jgi:hypothetical protein